MDRRIRKTLDDEIVMDVEGFNQHIINNKLTGYPKEVYISECILKIREKCLERGKIPLIYLMYLFELAEETHK